MASACVYIECPITGMILGVSRKDDPNAWGLPGGKVEGRETEEMCARRELMEETGIVIRQDIVLHEIFRREGGVTFRAYLTRDVAHYQVRPPYETGRVAWITIEQLLAGPFGDYNRALLTKIGRIK